MSKLIDITDKLSFEEKPKFTVKGIEFEANNDAITVLKVTAIMSGETTINDILKAYEMLFDEENQKKIETLKLSMNDFMSLVIEVAMSVMGNEEEPEGEIQTPATT